MLQSRPGEAQFCNQPPPCSFGVSWGSHCLYSASCWTTCAPTGPTSSFPQFRCFLLHSGNILRFLFCCGNNRPLPLRQRMCKLWIEGSPAPLGQFKLVDAVALAPRSRHLKHEVKVRLILDRRMNLGKDNSLWRHLCLIGERAWQAGAGIYGSIRPAWCSASLHLLLPTLKYSVFMKHPSAHVPELIILWDGMELILRISLDFRQFSECTALSMLAD